MNGTPPKVRITLVDAGERYEKVLQVLSKIQGLVDTPEQLIANIPCPISQEVPLPLAEKVREYLHKAGAKVEFEAFEEGIAPDSGKEEAVSSIFEAPGSDVTSFESFDEGSSEDETVVMTVDNEFGEFPSEMLDSVRTASSPRSRRDTAAPSSPQEFSGEAELLDKPAPQRRSKKRKRLSTRSYPGITVLVGCILLIGGGGWLYLSGAFSNLSDNIKRNPVVGTVGILEIDNEAEAEISLHRVVGTRVFNHIPLEGEQVKLERGDYYIEARKQSQILRFPVYIEGRGHRIRVNIVFPRTPAPFTHVAYIPAGWFRIGNKETTAAHFGFPDEKPDIDVYVSEFFLSKHEVTNREFVEFIEADGYENELYWERLIREWPSLVAQVPEYGTIYGNNGWQSVREYIHTRFVNTDDLPGPRLWEEDDPPYEYGRDEHPVLGVTLYEAEAYCKWRTQQTGKIHRLPTEAEWEKAARGYEGYFFSYGNEYDATRANTEAGETKKVGVYPANGYGLHDMTGSVWEWVSDHYQADAYQTLYDTYQTEIRNPRIYDGTYNRCIVRGGSFRSVNRINARNPVRYPMFPNYWHTNIGFRYAVMP